MSATIPTTEPLEFTAGELVQWTKDLSDFSYADGYRLTYYLRGPGTLDIAATADTDGKGHAATITAAESSGLPAGDYWIQGVVVNGSDTKSLRRTSLTVLPNPSQLAQGYDGRTHAQKMLDALKSAQISFVATGNGGRIKRYSIEGERSVEFMDESEWKTSYEYWEDRVNQEKKQAAIDRGERTGVYMRFRNPI